MTTSSGPLTDEPYLPELPTPSDAPPTVHDSHDPEVGRLLDLPFLPTSPRHEPPEPQPAREFDAKRMVESQKRRVPNPTYGHIPGGTAESLSAVEELREEARRKRVRNKRLGRVITVGIVGGLAVGGALSYYEYQRDQDEFAADRIAARETAAEAPDDPGSLGPLGEQVEIVAALDAVNSGAGASAGGLLGAVEAAEELVAEQPETTEEPDVLPIPESLTRSDIVPASAVGVATRQMDQDGFERYHIDVREFSALSTTEYVVWLRMMQAQEQLDASDPEFAVVPAVTTGEVAIALQADGDVVTRALIVGSEPDIAVAITP